jgi:hypothetical protein
LSPRDSPTPRFAKLGETPISRGTPASGKRIPSNIEGSLLLLFGESVVFLLYGSENLRHLASIDVNLPPLKPDHETILVIIYLGIVDIPRPKEDAFSFGVTRRIRLG